MEQYQFSATYIVLKKFIFVGDLPSVRAGLRGGNLNNNVFMTGLFNFISIIWENFCQSVLRDPKITKYFQIYWYKNIQFLGGTNSDGTLDEILMLNKKTLMWQNMNQMKEKRFAHAVSTVKLEDFQQFCQ